ncbi:MAG TPA: spore cortex biosynthesis protein YabQ [Clostridia bacterium]|nr:spore cortex biosynthesis protein YabQ [Clostridia bacterium]
MGISVTGQAIDFFLALLIGAALGAVYDVFRIMRLARSFGRVAVFIQDAVYFLICAVTTFLFLLVDNSGVVRAFLILGVLLGAVVYSLTLGAAVIKAAKRMIVPAKKIVRKAASDIAVPIRHVFGSAKEKIRISGGKVNIFTKKEFKVFKIRLQHHKRMLYNQIRPTEKRMTVKQKKDRKRRRRKKSEKTS